MAKNQKLNEEAALNNNLGSSTLKMNPNFEKLHQNSKKSNHKKKSNK